LDGPTTAFVFSLRHFFFSFFLFDTSEYEYYPVFSVMPHIARLPLTVFPLGAVQINCGLDEILVLSGIDLCRQILAGIQQSLASAPSTFPAFFFSPFIAHFSGPFDQRAQPVPTSSNVFAVIGYVSGSGRRPDSDTEFDFRLENLWIGTHRLALLMFPRCV